MLWLLGARAASSMIAAQRLGRGCGGHRALLGPCGCRLVQDQRASSSRTATGPLVPSLRDRRRSACAGGRTTLRGVTDAPQPPTAPAGEPIRVYLLDDHEIVRRGLKELLEAEGDIVVVGESGLAQEATRRIPALRPDVAILDGRLPDGSGIDVCRDVRSVDPTIKALILTSYDDDDALFAAIMAGAAGYILKQVRGNDFVDTVRRVAAGQSTLDPSVTARVLERVRSGPPKDESARRAHHPGAEDPRADRRGDDQPPDRRADVPRREDGEELRVVDAGQARADQPDPGGDLRHQAPAALS